MLPPLVRLDGSPLPPADLNGKAVLFVNVASFCGYTPQYTALEALWEARRGDGLVIVGVPCNQFGEQEPGTPAEIADFCRLNYGVTFPLLEKQDVNGADRSALYRLLVDSPAGGGTDIKWNFEKFLVGKDGVVRARFKHRTPPDDPTVTAAIADALR